MNEDSVCDGCSEDRGLGEKSGEGSENMVVHKEGVGGEHLAWMPFEFSRTRFCPSLLHAYHLT